jgi:outer membrane protein assembly factor BamA
MLGKRIRGVVTPFFERSDDRANPLYLLRQELHGVRFELRRDINRFSSISLTQDNLWAHQDALAQDTLPQSVFDTLVTRYTTHSLSLGGTWDFRDNPLNPFNGSYHAITGELAGGPLRGTSSFRKLGAVSSWYAPFRNGWVLAARIQGGVIHPFGTAPPLSIESQVDPDVARVPLGDRFRIGGVNSLRGYSESSIQPVGGLAMMLANVELRVPVVGPFGFELYADGGNVWSRPSDINGSDFTPGIGPEPLNPGDVHYVLGLGPRLNLPIGPLRLDLTWPLRPMPGTTRRNLVAQFAIGPTF